MEQEPIKMRLVTLKYRCSHEVSNYYQQKPVDDRYCLEIFRRAMLHNDNEAWAALQEQFSANVLNWLRSHARRQEALQIDTEQNYVDDTFKRLWQWGKNQQHEFQSLGGALTSLHLCLNSLIIDNLRAYTRNDRIPLLENRDSITPTDEGSYDKRELWETIKILVVDERELRVIYLLYHEGLKPREIIERCPGEFADEKEIYRHTRNALGRLKRNKDIIRWKISYDD